MNRIAQLIRTLSDIPGVSGCEDAVRAQIAALIKDSADTLHTDALGNLIAFKKGAKSPKNRIMLSAHMDEVGLIITHIEDDGLLRFDTVGGIDGRVMLGKRVEVGPGRLPGVIGGAAPHHLTEKEKETLPAPDKLFINIGAQNKQQAEQHVSIGERTVFGAQFTELGFESKRIMGRALDNRAGCALLVELINSPLPYDCHFTFTVQEESGCTGAATVAYMAPSDVVIVVETTTAADIQGTSEAEQICKLGGGPVVSYMDKRTLYDKALYDLAFETAAKNGISCQTKTAVVGGNDAGSIQQAGGGARVLAVSLPCRYLHSPLLMVDKDDVAQTYRLLFELIGAIDHCEL